MKRLIPMTALLLGCILPAPASAQPQEMNDLRHLRLKLSAADLYSAESILEAHRGEKGEDAEYVLGMAWLARGAALTGHWDAASRYARAARELAVARLGTPPKWDDNREAQYALGTAIEVEAQALVLSGKKTEAMHFLEESSKAQEKAPYNLRARIWKRRNLIELAGQKAPGFRTEDHVGAEFPGLESLRGRPVVLFFWWEACGDCRAQAPALRRTIEKYAPRGVTFVATTRFYRDDRPEEKAKIETAWKEVYGFPGSVSGPISDEAMLRYGVSATPTFAFVDRRGVVQDYLPYRLTDERLSEAIEKLLP
jgi:thiol-disulfide isomerase/thioredoxin